MEFYFFGLLVGLVGAIPLFLTKHVMGGGIATAIYTMLVGTFFYLAIPSYCYPWLGCYGFLAIVALAISATVACAMEDRPYRHDTEGHLCDFVAVIVGCLVAAYIITPLFGSSMFRASDYAALLGKPEARVWTTDVQPKDPRHIRMASQENAEFLAKQTLGQAGSIGSQFHVASNSLTPQMIKRDFRIIAPLDFNGFWEWNASGAIPGYVVINGEDPTVAGQLVQLPPDQQFRYSPNACFGYNLRRHLIRKGFGGYDFAAEMLEIDDNNKPWWVVTIFKPTVMWWGEKFLGVIVIDPVSGDCQSYLDPDKIPKWIDLAMPEDFVERYITWHGLYAGGWLNYMFGKKDLTESEDAVMIYGSDGEPYHVTGVTSSSATDSSLVGLYYTHTRTGKTTYYKAQGSTDAAILAAVNKNEQVQFRKLHGAVPQIYNVHNTMASVVPLLNENHIFQGVAIVNVQNVQIIGVGKDQFEALRQYERALPMAGHQIAPEITKAKNSIRGKVDRIAAISQGPNTIFYVYIAGTPHVFTAGTELSPKLPITKIGDDVAIEFYASGQMIEPMSKFENWSVMLKSSDLENQVKEKTSTH